MPELPEVETIKLGLQKYLVGHTIEDIELRLPKQFRGDPKSIIGGKVREVRRYGKGLVIDLDNGYSLAIHVKMTGQLLYVNDARGPAAPHPSPTSSLTSFTAGARLGVPSRVTPRLLTSATRSLKDDSTRLADNLPDKYTHVVFSLDKEAVLYYRDMRQFGWVHALPTAEVPEMPFFKRLGPEPLRDLTLEKFRQLLERKTPIKLLLLDQTKIAGIGNIYVNDALYLAKIHPQRPASSVTKQEQKTLFEAIETVLQKGIAVGGASQWQYVDVLGGKGQYQNFFLAYHKHGTACLRCGTLFETIKMGGRGTFFCPTCQI